MYKILMVEDDEMIAEVYKHKIAAEGYDVAIALNGESALEMLRTFHPDLLLLDMMLPGMSGLDVLKTLRGHPQFASLTIVAFSGSGSGEILHEAMRYGATRTLSKGEFTPTQIVARITETLSQSGIEPTKTLAIQTLAQWAPPAGRVLVVEDDPIIMALVQSIVEDEDYTVVPATDGREAYRIMATDSDFVACIFDVNVPFIEGPDLLRHMKTEKRLMNIPVMIMTANESLYVQSQSISAGAAVFIAKPFTRSALKTMFTGMVRSVGVT